MILLEEKGLKDIEDKVKKVQDRGFEPMRGLHIDSRTSIQGKELIGITVMQENFSKFRDSLIDISSSNQNRVAELQKLSRCIHVVMEDLLDQLNVVKEWVRENSKWLLRYTNIHVPRHEQLIPIIVVAKAYRAKNGKGREGEVIHIPPHFIFLCNHCNTKNWFLSICHSFEEMN